MRRRLPFSGDLCIDHDSAFAIAGGPVGPCKLLAGKIFVDGGYAQV